MHSSPAQPPEVCHTGQAAWNCKLLSIPGSLQFPILLPHSLRVGLQAFVIRVGHFCFFFSCDRVLLCSSGFPQAWAPAASPSRTEYWSTLEQNHCREALDPQTWLLLQGLHLLTSWMWAYPVSLIPLSRDILVYKIGSSVPLLSWLPRGTKKITIKERNFLLKKPCVDT